MYYKGLIEFLNKHKYLILPGIGQLCVRSQSAFLDSSAEQVFSPRKLVSFSPAIGESLAFQLSTLESSWQKTESQTKFALEKLSTKILSLSLSDQSYTLPGVGEFSSLDGKIVFQSSGEIEKQYNYFNSEIRLHKTFVIAPSVARPETLAELNTIESLTNDNASDINQKEIDQLLAEDADTSKYVVIRPKYYRVAAAMILFLLFSLVGIGLMKTDSNLVKPVKYTIDSTEIAVDRINKAPISDGSELNKDHIVSELEYNDSIAEQRSNANSQVEKSKPTFIQNKELEECIYIMGSFSKEKYIDAMLLRLEDKGYEVYRAPFNGTTRIGVRIPCNDTESLHNIAQIEENYWLLN